MWGETRLTLWAGAASCSRERHTCTGRSEQLLARGGGGGQVVTLLLVDQITRSCSLDRDTSRSSDTAIATTSFLCLSSKNSKRILDPTSKYKST